MSIIFCIIITHLIKRYRQFWTSTFVVFAGMFIGKSFSFVWKLILARKGITNLGAIEVVFNTITILSSFALLGFQTSLIRFASIELKKNNRQKVYSYFAYVLKLTIIISLIFVLLSFLPFRIIDSIFKLGKSQLPLSRNFLWILPFVVSTEIFLSFLNAIKKTKEYTFTKYISNQLFRLTIFIFLSNLLSQVLIAYLLTWFGVIILAKIPLRKLIYTTPINIKKYLSYTFPMSGSFIFFVLYGTVDIFLLNHYSDLKTVGIFAVLTLFSDGLDLLFLPSLNFLQSYLSNYYKDKKEGMKFIRFNILIFILSGLLAVVLFYFFRSWFMLLFLKKKEIVIADFLIFFMLLKIMQSGIILPLRHFLDFYGHTKITLTLMIISFLAKAGFGIIFIPKYGLRGLAIALLLTQLIHLIGCVISIKRAELNYFQA